MKFIILTILSIVGCFILSSHAAPSSTSAGSCETLLPEGAEPEEGDDIFVNLRQYPNGTIHVDVLLAGANNTYNGFILQARESKDPQAYETVGKFIALESDAQAKTCLSEDDTATYISETETNFVTTEWVVPVGFSNVTFRGSVARSSGEVTTFSKGPFTFFIEPETSIYSHGSLDSTPSGSCETLLPEHGGAEAEEGDDIFVNLRQYPNGTIHVDVLLAGPNNTYNGFILQARDSKDPQAYETVGKFVALESDAQTKTCLSEDDTATYISETETNFVTTEWVAPEGFSNVTFRGSVVRLSGDVATFSKGPFTFFIEEETSTAKPSILSL